MKQLEVKGRWMSAVNKSLIARPMRKYESLQWIDYHDQQEQGVGYNSDKRQQDHVYGRTKKELSELLVEV